jgi:hypothetical protein
MDARTPIPLRPALTALDRENRRSLVRALTAQALAGLRGQLDTLGILQRAWRSDRVAEWYVRAATSPIGTANFPATEGVASLVLLAPSSAALRLFDAQLKLTLGANATVRIPSVSVPPVAPFVSELSPGPMLQATLAATSLGPTRKLLLLSAISEELEHASPETASVVIGHILAASAAKSIDATAFDSNAGDDVRPPGLLHNIVPIAATAGGGAAAMAADISNLAQAMAVANTDPDCAAGFQVESDARAWAMVRKVIE